MTNRFGAVVAAGLASAAIAMSSPREACAQTVTRVSATPQGTIGGALLGAEAVILIEGAAGVRNKWVLLGTGIAGLVAGGVGGWALDFYIDDLPPIGQGRGSANPNPPGLSAASTAMLVVGLGLVIPTAIMFVSATMYRPEEPTAAADDGSGGNEVLEESAGTPTTGTNGQGTAPAGPTTPAGGANPPTSQLRLRRQRHASAAQPRLTGALVGVHNGRVELGVPAVGVVSSFSTEETRQFGLTHQSEVRIPVLSAQF